jgi:hypothetical protein
MKYQKPEVAVATEAITAIQNHLEKGIFNPTDSEPSKTTVPAYEADE